MPLLIKNGLRLQNGVRIGSGGPCCCGGAPGDDCLCPEDCVCEAGQGTIYRNTSYHNGGAPTGNPADVGLAKIGTIPAGAWCIKYNDGYVTNEFADISIQCQFQFYEKDTFLYVDYLITGPGVGGIGPCVKFTTAVDIWAAHMANPLDYPIIGPEGMTSIRVCAMDEARLTQYPNWQSTRVGGVWGPVVFTGWSNGTPDTTPLNQWNITGDVALWSGTPEFTCDVMVFEPYTPSPPA